MRSLFLQDFAATRLLIFLITIDCQTSLIDDNIFHTKNNNELIRQDKREHVYITKDK